MMCDLHLCTYIHIYIYILICIFVILALGTFESVEVYEMK